MQRTVCTAASCAHKAPSHFVDVALGVAGLEESQSAAEGLPIGMSRKVDWIEVIRICECSASTQTILASHSCLREREIIVRIIVRRVSV